MIGRERNVVTRYSSMIWTEPYHSPAMVQREILRDGGDVQIDYRFAPGGAGQEQVLANELIALQPNVILAHTTLIGCGTATEKPRDPNRVR